MDTLGRDTRTRVQGARRLIEQAGPNAGRPRADTINGSRFHNMKELRIAGTIRVLFAFDPHRRAVMLLGGDKRNDPERWYRTYVPKADGLYADHLRRIGKGEQCRSRTHPSRTRTHGGR